MLVRELLRLMDTPVLFYGKGMKFYADKNGMGGFFVKGAKMLPVFVDMEGKGL